MKSRIARGVLSLLVAGGVAMAGVAMTADAASAQTNLSITQSVSCGLLNESDTLTVTDTPGATDTVTVNVAGLITETTTVTVGANGVGSTVLGGLPLGALGSLITSTVSGVSGTASSTTTVTC